MINRFYRIETTMTTTLAIVSDMSPGWDENPGKAAIKGAYQIPPSLSPPTRTISPYLCRVAACVSCLLNINDCHLRHVVNEVARSSIERIVDGDDCLNFIEQLPALSSLPPYSHYHCLYMCSECFYAAIACNLAM